VSARLPLEVVLVSQASERKYRKAAVLLLTGTVLVLLGGAGLMWLLPLASEVVGTPRRTPGYWPCVAVLTLTRLVFRSAFSTVSPRPRAEL